MGCPSVAFAGGALDEEDFGFAVLDPVLGEESVEIGGSRVGVGGPVGVGGFDAEDEGYRGAFLHSWR